MNYLNKILSMTALIWMTTSCTETEIIEAPELAANRILEFKVINLTEPVYAAVDQENLSINLYLPFYYYLNILETEITVSDGATITLDDDNYVEDVVGIIKDDKQVTYTVTDVSGNAIEYTLNITCDQPELTIEEVSSEDYIHEVAIATFYPYNGDVAVVPGGVGFKADGGLVKPNEQEVAKVFFINENGEEFESTQVGASSTYISAAFLDHEIMIPGIYYIRVELYTKIITLKYPIMVTEPLDYT